MINWRCHTCFGRVTAGEGELKRAPRAQRRLAMVEAKDKRQTMKEQVRKHVSEHYDMLQNVWFLDAYMNGDLYAMLESYHQLVTGLSEQVAAYKARATK